MFSASCQYAIRAVLYLANHTSEQKKIGVNIIAEELQIPKPFLAKVLQRLTKSELVSSAKGRHGGFYLSKENRSRTLLPVIEAMDGPHKFDMCVLLGLEECSSMEPCPYHDSVKVYRDRFHRQLQSETIVDVAKRIAGSNMSVSPKQPPKD